MKIRFLFLVFIILAGAMSAWAQSRTITNAGLESYRQQRLDNEKYYRENYERLGLPSPEEIDRRNEDSAKELAELSNKLRTEELERERIASQRVTLFHQPSIYRPTIVVDNTIYGYHWRNRGYHWGPGRSQYVQPGYFAGGAFWPTGSATPSQPMWAPTRR